MLSIHIFTIRTDWPIICQMLGEAHPSDRGGNRPLQISQINRMRRQVTYSRVQKPPGKETGKREHCGGWPWGGAIGTAFKRSQWTDSSSGCPDTFPAHTLGAVSL